MAVTEGSRATKKSEPISLGRKIARFKTKKVDRHFTVHEDIVCSISGFFKSKLQDGRAIGGECVVCHENFDSSFSDITFCKGCGQNIHETCLEKWRSEQASYPMYRGEWKEEQYDVLSIKRTLNQQAVDRYLQWVYSTGKLDLTTCLPSGPRLLSDNRSTCVNILRQHPVGIAMQDKKFTTAVVKSFEVFYEMEIFFWLDSEFKTLVKEAYDTIAADSRKFLVDVFMTRIKPG